MTTQDFIKKAFLVHSTKYDYSETIYTTARNKLKVICNLHGEFTQRAHSHLQGKGCPSCGTMQRLKERISKRKSTEDFIKQAKLVHSDKYDYSITKYITAKTSLAICCPNHGVFKQIAYNHLNGTGCPKCATKGWSDKEWEILAKKSKYFEAYYLYVIECWSNKESFIKVGKTFTNLSKRFTNSFPYQWKLLKIIEGDYKYISETERNLQKLIWEYKYTPKLPFSGQTECFTIDSLQFLDV